MKARLGFLMLALALPASATRYDDPSAWQAKVGDWQSESFAGMDELLLPMHGGVVPIGDLAVALDDQGSNESSGHSGLYRGDDWPDAGLPADLVTLIVSTEQHPYHGETGGPYAIDAVFPVPVVAYAFDYAWCEFPDPEDCTFAGFVLDAPATRVSLTEPMLCDHAWCAISLVRWVPVPEPSTGVLLALGLLGLWSFSSRASRICALQQWMARSPTLRPMDKSGSVSQPGAQQRERITAP